MTPSTDLEATVTALAPRLLRYCVGRSGDPGLAEDASQEALTALVQSWRLHGPPESPEGFAFVVARRRLGRRLLRRRLMEPLDALFGKAAEEDPHRELLARDDLESALVALAGLSPKLREALLLVAAGELDTATAAEVLGISTSALKMRISRAREALGKRFDLGAAPIRGGPAQDAVAPDTSPETPFSGNPRHEP
ncbi:MAG: RNA polymerase sigma factor [Acidobacteriota bacterium]